ncbi:hypothetical protein J8273_4191 [Carpediemonas membranifera]|uniref:Uncharacterized protein n=1 Tax=Carpediemonas membranifera TaxID=201153 RepID=A0A8J6B7T0_9EUKA|nr:hypothetical protein J8273_4191 [Carpediemonas membranifera]|eukprot:KAG9394517.1 hypothetical protein J8273_4191 [Carpediemonas membranifera]
MPGGRAQTYSLAAISNILEAAKRPSSFQELEMDSDDGGVSKHESIYSELLKLHPPKAKRSPQKPNAHTHTKSPTKSFRALKPGKSAPPLATSTTPQRKSKLREAIELSKSLGASDYDLGAVDDIQSIQSAHSAFELTDEESEHEAASPSPTWLDASVSEEDEEEVGSTRHALTMSLSALPPDLRDYAPSPAPPRHCTEPEMEDDTVTYDGEDEAYGSFEYEAYENDNGNDLGGYNPQDEEDEEDEEETEETDFTETYNRADPLESTLTSALEPIPTSSPWPSVDYRPAVSSPLSKLAFSAMGDASESDTDSEQVESGWGFRVPTPLAIVEASGVSIEWDSSVLPSDTANMQFGLSLLKQRLSIDSDGRVNPIGSPELLIENTRDPDFFDADNSLGGVTMYVLVPMKGQDGRWKDGPASDAAVVAR